MDAAVEVRDAVRPSARADSNRIDILLAVAAFAVLCVLVLIATPRMVEPDDYAYRASVTAMTQGHFLSLSTAQYEALSEQLFRTEGAGPGIAQWVRLADGRLISEKDPGYPFLTVAFQALGIIRLAPLFYGALGCLGLFFGARRWLGRFGGAAAVGLFCSSGAALLFAWRDYMPTFIDASLIAAGTGALLWVVLATEASSRRRTWTGLAGFVAIEAAVFTRYTDVAALGCAVAAVIAVRMWTKRLPAGALAWWLGSVAVFGAGVAVFDDLVYGGPFKSGYQPGEIQFGLGAIPVNLRQMPAHLIETMPMLVLGLAAVVWIVARWAVLRAADGERAVGARRDLGVGLALAASWFCLWGVYAAYTWTTAPFASNLQVVRFYVPALGAIALLGAWLVVHLPRLSGRASLAAMTSAAVVAAMFGLGAWSFADMRANPMGGLRSIHGGCVGHLPPGVRSGPPPGAGNGPPPAARGGPCPVQVGARSLPQPGKAPA